VRAGPDGRYRLPPTAAGGWTLVAALPDVRAAIRAIKIAAGGACTDLDLVLGEPAHAVTGAIVDVSGGGVKEAMIVLRATLAPTAPPVALAMSDADGRYRLAAPEGDYLVQVRHPDYVGVDGAISVRGPSTFDATLTPGSSVRGVVLARDTRTPIPGARVTIRGGRASGAMGGLVREVTTDDDGRFTATGLGSGRIFLTAVGPAQANHPPLELALGIAESRDKVEILVDPARRIRGVVTRGGAPVANALVNATRSELANTDEMSAAFAQSLTGADRPVETDDAGVFEVWGLPPGAYDVTAEAPGSLPSATVRADVTRGDADGVVLELRAGVAVRGRVEPAQVANVSLSGFSSPTGLAGGTVATGADGVFELAGVEPGEVTLTAETYTGLAGEAVVTVGPAGAADVVVKLARRGVAVAGRVTDTSGAPVAGVTVASFGVTSTDGTFRAPAVEPGEYGLSVFEGEDELDVVSPTPESGTIAVPEGGLPDLAIVVDARDRTLRGIVIGPDGKPAPDAWVVASRTFEGAGLEEILPGIDLSSLAFDWTGRTKVALTGADGRFAIAHLRKGVYDVAAEGAKGAARGVVHAVPVDRQVRIPLVALGGLELTVEQGGAPVRHFTLTVEGPEPDTRTIDAPDGRVALTTIPPGEYHIRASTDGAVGRITATLAPGATVHATITLAAWSSVAGTVVDAATGKLIPNVTAWIDDAVPSFSGDSAPPWITDAAGRFKLDRVPPGKGEVAIYTFGAEPVRVPYVATEGATVDVGTIRATAPPPEPVPQPGIPEEPAAP
ncbi:MAG: carboxypeptidase regulatory-like domain-containing protein, partial [Deltaproteobacteria bacterium]|nr:carboxypeptidase regulatory-like domain-containing protein [Deltaproteobacteria bacterium]